MSLTIYSYTKFKRIQIDCRIEMDIAFIVNSVFHGTSYARTVKQKTNRVPYVNTLSTQVNNNNINVITKYDMVYVRKRRITFKVRVNETNVWKKQSVNARNREVRQFW